MFEVFLSTTELVAFIVFVTWFGRYILGFWAIFIPVGIIALYFKEKAKLREVKQGPHPIKTIIIGAGMSGIKLASEFEKRGESYTILEKSDDVGGTWKYNVYPGCQCDVPSYAYSFSTDRHLWTLKWSNQDEILAYLRGIVTKHNIRKKISFNKEVKEAVWDEATKQWTVTCTDKSTFKANVVVISVGQLNTPSIPSIPGIDSFQGPKFHSAWWDTKCDLTGKRVAVIGTGASAIQIIPAIVDKVKHLTTFQRTPSYIMGNKILFQNFAYPDWAKKILTYVPLAALFYRWWFFFFYEFIGLIFEKESKMNKLFQQDTINNMKADIKNPELLKKVIPDHPLGCKRILRSTDYLPAIQKPNVDFITDGISQITKTGVIAGGKEYPVDAIVFCTGFKSTSFFFPIQVKDKTGKTLNQVWTSPEDGEVASAYLGIALPNYPNLFCTYGPNTNLGHNSIVFMIETQVHYITELISTMNKNKIKALTVKPEVMKTYYEEGLTKNVFSYTCNSWYKTASGKIPNNWPYSCIKYWWRTLTVNLNDYLISK